MSERGRNSRKLLLEAAVVEFAESGYAGARTDRIATDAGVNKQLIFYYFQSKAALYDAVLQDARRRLNLALNRDAEVMGPGPDALRRHLRALFSALVQEPAITRLIIRGLRETEPAGAPARAAVAEFVSEFATLISRGQGTGYFRDDADPALAARQAVVLLLGYLDMAGALNGGTGDDPPDHDAWLDGASDLLVRSLAW